MAKPKNNPEATTVTRVVASDDTKTAKKPKKTAARVMTSDDEMVKKQNIFKKFIGYFKGSWYELKQVRWPNRRATWGMTAALLIFTAFFVLLIVVTDTLWEYLFKLTFER